MQFPQKQNIPKEGTMSTTIGFIGGGNMASALISGLISKELYKPQNIMASAASEKSVQRLTNVFGIKATTSNKDIVESCYIIVLAVKPYMVFKVIDEIGSTLKKDQLVISIASGIKLEKLMAEIGRAHV